MITEFSINLIDFFFIKNILNLRIENCWAVSVLRALNVTGRINRPLSRGRRGIQTHTLTLPLAAQSAIIKVLMAL